MILTEFPDLHWLKTQIDQRFANRKAWGGGTLREQGWPTVILNARTKEISRENIRGPLSLFYNAQGSSRVTADGYAVKVNPGFFFLTNPDQHYSLEIKENTPTETFNIHFGTHFAEQACASLLKSPEFLLEHPNERHPDSLNFYNRLYPKDGTVSHILQTLQTKDPVSDIFVEQQLYQLIAHLLVQQNHLASARESIPALRNSTKEEIVRRLLITTDYIYAYYSLDLSLDDLARTSCLSKFHFLRLFKIAFRKTPHQFITEVRLQKAKELLKLREVTVNQVARDVGFQNPSSFSRLFYNQLGMYPTEYKLRAQV